MAQLISENAITFGPNDPTTIQGFESYKNKAFAKLHKHFYAVMMHGEPNLVYGDKVMTAKDFAPHLKESYKIYGKGRAILMISCWVGWEFSGLLANIMQLPVVAALSKVAFGMHLEKGQMKSHIEASDKNAITNHQKMRKTADSMFYVPDLKFFIPEWKIFYPSGRSETIKGGMYLNQDEAVRLVQAYHK